MKKIILLTILMGAAALAKAAENSSAAATLPEMVRYIKISQTAYAGYSAAKQAAEQAADSQAGGFRDLPESKRPAAISEAQAQRRASVKTMIKELEIMRASMTDMQILMKKGFGGGFSEIEYQLDGILSEYSSRLSQHGVSISSSASLGIGVSSDPSGLGQQRVDTLTTIIELRKKMMAHLLVERARVKESKEALNSIYRQLRERLNAVEETLTELKTEQASGSGVWQHKGQNDPVISFLLWLGVEADADKSFDTYYERNGELGSAVPTEKSFWDESVSAAQWKSGILTAQNDDTL